MRTEVKIKNKRNRQVIDALESELRPFGGAILVVTQNKHSQAKFKLGDHIRTIVWSSSPRSDDKCIVNAARKDLRKLLRNLGYLL